MEWTVCYLRDDNPTAREQFHHETTRDAALRWAWAMRTLHGVRYIEGPESESRRDWSEIERECIARKFER
jgi:hypothetical protein